jgi:lactate dehydrogenase-like 2-hydroxyacid dehydrogenase
MTIGFLTPYKHLPDFAEYVEKEYRCVNLLTDPQHVDFIFSAPNYDNCVIGDTEVLKFTPTAILSPSTGTNHITTNLVPVVDIKNDTVLEYIPSTAEHNLYLILSLVRTASPIQQLGDLTLGILGYGRLGKMLHSKCANLFKSVEYKDINEQSPNFYTDTDILSLNIDLTDNNIDFIDSKFLSKFNKDLFIVNTSRGEIINEEELIIEIKNNKVLGYATDVIKEENSNTNTALKEYSKTSNIIITPHIGGTAIGAQELAYKRTVIKSQERYGK